MHDRHDYSHHLNDTDPSAHFSFPTYGFVDSANAETHTASRAREKEVDYDAKQRAHHAPVLETPEFHHHHHRLDFELRGMIALHAGPVLLPSSQAPYAVAAPYDVAAEPVPASPSALACFLCSYYQGSKGKILVCRECR